MHGQQMAAEDGEVVNRVLVVDDDEGITELLHMVLEEEGYQVEIAATGPAAIDFLGHTKDAWIVLLDVMLPQLSGLEVCAHLRAAGPAAARHRVALMTAGRLHAQDCPSPVRRLLRKPFDLRTLRELVAALANGREERPSQPPQPRGPYTRQGDPENNHMPRSH